MINHINIYRLIAGIIFTIVIIFQINSIIENCGGNFIYPLDDTYIHLSVAKKLSNHGVWGVTQHEFSSSSSSILFTLLLSLLMFIFGNNELLPLVVNFLTSYLLIIYIYNFLIKQIEQNSIFDNQNSNIYKEITALSITLFIIFATPLLILTISGMEHVIQIFINLAFINVFLNYLSGREKNDLNKLLFLSAMVTAVRFEGVFLIFITLTVLLIKKDFKISAFLILFSAFPIVIFGLISYSNDWMFLPNSILLKSTKPDSYDAAGIILYPLKWLFKLSNEHHLLSIFIAATGLLYVNFRKRRELLNFNNLLLIFTVSLIIIHLTFAKTGWVYRYEAYIVVIGLISVAINSFEFLKYGEKNLKFAISILLILIVVTTSNRAVQSINETNTMSVNIYEQQYQMSQFLAEYYNNSTIVLGDIGACTYYTNIKLIDLVALGSIEPLKMRLNKNFNSSEVFKLANKKNARIAILYKEAFEDYIPDAWIEVGSWKIHNNVGCYMDKVTFYAVNSEYLLELNRNLINFKKDMPADIEINLPLEQIMK